MVQSPKRLTPAAACCAHHIKLTRLVNRSCNQSDSLSYGKNSSKVRGCIAPFSPRGRGTGQHIPAGLHMQLYREGQRRGFEIDDRVFGIRQLPRPDRGGRVSA